MWWGCCVCFCFFLMFFYECVDEGRVYVLYFFYYFVRWCVGVV